MAEKRDERYVIGPGLRDKLREVITRVDAVPAETPFNVPVRLQDIGSYTPRGFRTGTFTGTWGIGQTRVVTFKYQPTATATVYNDLMNLPNAGQRNCIVGKEGTAWRLVNWQWDVAHAATQASLTTTMLQFHTLPVGAVATASTVTFNISVASCSTAAV